LDQLRLQRIKGYGRAAMPYSLPAEWQGRVIAELERYVTAIQFPADLSDAKAAEIVRARVAGVLRPYHEAVENAARQKRDKEAADRRKVALIAHGNEYARRETEREVEDEVDEILDEWDDDEDDEGEDEWDDEDD
jgi:hypothetical protein